MARQNPDLGPWAPVVLAALRTGELEQEKIEGETYIWPQPSGDGRDRPVPQDVRFLAPFDPLVWDRRRFEHLWGWSYRFEAYTPPPKRLFGYYAMPLLWGDAVIGWANVSLAAGKVGAATGYARHPPRSLVFRRGLDAELARMERFLSDGARRACSSKTVGRPRPPADRGAG